MFLWYTVISLSHGHPSVFVHVQNCSNFCRELLLQFEGLQNSILKCQLLLVEELSPLELKILFLR